MNIRNLILDSTLTPIEKQPFEFVERKGIGHPDTLADGIAESISVEYSKYCLGKIGVIPHQMLDKILIMGGNGKFGYGIGEMTKPWRLVINGRLSTQFGKRRIPSREISIRAAKNYLMNVVPGLDVDRWLKIYYFTTSYSKNPNWFKPRSIADIPDAKNPHSNDTSFCSGYWPLSLTEKLSLILESYFYKPNYSPKISFVGQDIKVMCVRQKSHICITMCVPFFSKQISTKEFYFKKKEVIYEDLQRLIKIFLKDRYSFSLFLNTQDDLIKTYSNGVGHYFVISGSALDSGEEGLVGRGNKSRGFIASVRPNSMEAICGKNPVYYVGKLYNYLADILSKLIAETFKCECVVFISSRNGDPIFNLDNVFIKTSKKISRDKLTDIIKTAISKRNFTKEILSKSPFIPIPGGGHGYSAFKEKNLKTH